MNRARRFFPTTGAAYELFDAAVFLFLLAVIGYILTGPSAIQEKTLGAPLDLFPGYVWGTALAVVAVFAIACSYLPRMLRRGYLAMIVACSFWSANFVIGMLFGALDHVLPYDFFNSYDFSVRAFISVLLYGWITSRLVRDIPNEVEV